MHQKIGTLQTDSWRTVAIQLYEQLGQVNVARCAYDSTIVSLLYLVYRFGGTLDADNAKVMLKQTKYLTPKAAIKKIMLLCSLR